MKHLQLGEFKSTDDLHIFSGSFFKHQDLLFQDGSLDCLKPVELSREEYLSIHQISVAAYLKNLPALRDHFNTINGTTYSTDFWHTFLANWSAMLISNFVDKYVKLTKFINQASEPYSVDVLEPSSIFFLDDENFQANLPTSEEINHYLSSIIINHYSQKLISLGWKINRIKIELIFNKEYPLRSYTPINSKIDHITGLSRFERFILNLSSSLNSKVKKIISISQHSKNFESIQIPDLPWTDLLFTFHPETYKKIPNQKPEFKFNFLISASNYRSQFEKRLETALAREAGTRIFLSQHGSNYGDQYTSTHCYITEYLYDGFISWSKREHPFHPGKIISLPAPILSKISIRRFLHRRKKSCVYVATTFTPNISGPCLMLDTDKIRNHFQMLSQLISKLSDQTRSNFFYRSRPTHQQLAFNIHGQILKRFPDLNLHTGNFDSSILDTSLVIHDNIGSSLHKTYAAKIPNILYWEKDSIFINDHLRNDLSQENGHFNNSKDLALCLNSIFKDDNPLEIPTANWPLFTEQHCHHSPLYLLKWIREILTL